LLADLLPAAVLPARESETLARNPGGEEELGLPVVLDPVRPGLEVAAPADRYRVLIARSSPDGPI